MSKEATMKINIQYIGSTRCVSIGELDVTVDGTTWRFPYGCVAIDTLDNSWYFTDYPKNFPEESKEVVTDVLNDYYPRGCESCEGCP
jgi:hypothetical protein